MANNNTKNGKKKKEGINNSVGFDPGTFDSRRLHLTTTPQRLVTQSLGKNLLFYSFSMKLPPAR